MRDWTGPLRSRLAPLHLDPAREAEIVEELSQHLDQRCDELIAGGATEDGARQLALAELHGRDELARQIRPLRQAHVPLPIAAGTPSRGGLRDVWQDFRYALRQLRRQRTFTAIAVLCLTLGIGANTAIFAVLDAALLRTLPVPSPHDLVVVRGVHPRGGGAGALSYPGFTYLRDHATGLEGMFAWAPTTISLAAGSVTDAPSALLVSDRYFATLGVRPPIGRTFASPDEQAVVISDRFWRLRFGGDPAVVGRDVLVNGLPFTIAGVLPRSFFGTEVGRSPDVFVPLALADRLRTGAPRLPRANNFWLTVMARRVPGVSDAQAAEQATAVHRQTAVEHSTGLTAGAIRHIAERRIALAPGAWGIQSLGTQFRQPLVVLMAIVCLVLLIACVNVANLLLTRTAARRQEIAIRLALGAGRARLFRQFLTESVTLAVTGGALGLFFAAWSVRVLTSYFPGQLLEVTLDARVLAFAAGVSLLTGIVFGAAPAWRAARADLTPDLKARAGAGRSGRRRTGRWLVAAQVAISLVLLIAAGLFLRTLGNLRALDPGFGGRDVLLATIDPGLNRYAADRTSQFFGELAARVSAFPGVRSVSVAGDAPLTGSYIDGFTITDSKQSGETSIRIVGPGFFETMGIAIRRGRDFTASDLADARGVVIVNDTIARTYFRGGDPLGSRLTVGDSPGLEVVGVVADTKYRTLRDPVPNTLYLLMDQATWSGSQRTLLVRTTGRPADVAGAVRGAVQALDGAVPVAIRPFSQVLDDHLAQERLVATLSGFFGGLALLLTSLGLYGVVAQGVHRRTREIGIRMSLGAARAAVLRLMLRDCLVPVSAGLAVGLVSSVWLSRFVARQLFGITPFDPATLAAATILLALVALIAGYLPARRASRLNPVAALRAD